MNATAIVIDKPGAIALRDVTLTAAGPDEVVAAVRWSGISTGTEKLFYDGTMPPFPGSGYPLVPGYESVATVSQAGADTAFVPGDRIFVPGAHCYRDVKALFGATSSRVVVKAGRAIALPDGLESDAVLVSLAATAHHALALRGTQPPDLVIGHGALGRLIARICVALGHEAPVIWEKSPARRESGEFDVIGGETDPRRDYRSIIDASGDPEILDTAIARLEPGGSITLAGFYNAPLTFAFAPAFMREASIRIAAEFNREDIDAVLALVTARRLSLAGIITHEAAPADCGHAYETAFREPACTKMVLDWRSSR